MYLPKIAMLPNMQLGPLGVNGLPLTIHSTIGRFNLIKLAYLGGIRHLRDSMFAPLMNG